MPSYLLRLRDRRNSVLLDQAAECPNAVEALAEARTAVRGMMRRLGDRIDPLGRIDVEDQGRPVARLLLVEELRDL